MQKTAGLIRSMNDRSDIPRAGPSGAVCGDRGAMALSELREAVEPNGVLMNRDVRRGPNGKGLRILIVTPEIASLPDGLSGAAPRIVAKGGGLADVTASLAEGLEQRGMEVHVALPHYRRLFGVESQSFEVEGWKNYKRKSALSRIHLAEDRSFYYRDQVYSYQSQDNPDVALAFQREVINNILLKVDPDIVHCHDWWTGLVPAAAKRLGIPCVFTLHNIHSELIPLAHIEHCGIDAAEFWQSLFFESYPDSYEASRDHNRVDLLASAILASDQVNTVSPTFLGEVIQGRCNELPMSIRDHLASMRDVGTAQGILNAPHSSYDPSSDGALVRTFDSKTAEEGKRANKVAFQELTGLSVNPAAPLFFWPSRLDPVQKGCQLLTEILEQLVNSHADEGLQIAFVADGSYQRHFHDIVNLHSLHERVVVCNFDENLSRLGYAASDFTLMPSLFEPCGLAQMIAMLYGSLPIVHCTGGLKDSVSHLAPEGGAGNGFVFETFDAGGFGWAIEQALGYFGRDSEWRAGEVARIMDASRKSFGSDRMIDDYLGIYRGITTRQGS